MDVIDFLMKYWWFISSVVTLGATVVVLWLSSRYIPRAECGKNQAACVARQQELTGKNVELAKRLDTEDAALKRMEDLLSHLPTIEALHELAISFTRLDGRINAVEVQLRGQNDVLTIVRQNTDRVHNYLMEYGIGAK